MKKLIVKGRYLAWEDGEPFFYLADTAWELFHILTREETEYYFKERSRQGFNASQIVALAEYSGLTTPNAYGRYPLKFKDGVPDVTHPDTDGEYSYWDHVDFAVQTAEKYGMFVVFVLTWGDKFNLRHGVGPVIFDPENAYRYAKFITERYKKYPNVIWMLGGDRALETKEHREIVDAMAKAIRETDTEHLITFHAPGSHASTDYLADAPYLDFHTSQSGHVAYEAYRSDEFMMKMRNASDKPYLESESRYEDHPIDFKPDLGYWNDVDVRQNTYWNVLSGACGQTYGNHNVWYMNREPKPYFPFTWQQVMNHPGAEQMRFVKELRLSRDYFSLTPAPELLCGNYQGMGHMTAAAGNGYVFVYSPLGLPFTLNPKERFPDAKLFRIQWFDPRTGEGTYGGTIPNIPNTFAPPSSGRGNDWVLILDVIL